MRSVISSPIIIMQKYFLCGENFSSLFEQIAPQPAGRAVVYNDICDLLFYVWSKADISILARLITAIARSKILSVFVLESSSLLLILLVLCL